MHRFHSFHCRRNRRRTTPPSYEWLQRADALACSGDSAHRPLRVTGIERPALEYETRDGGVAEQGGMGDAQLGKLFEPGRLENRVVVLDGEERYHHRHLPLLSLRVSGLTLGQARPPDHR